MIGSAAKAAQTPAEEVAAVVATIERPVVETIVNSVAKGLARDNVEIASPTSELDALNPPDK